jgi:hypothetical protein
MKLTYFQRIKMIYWGAFFFMIMYTGSLFYIDRYNLENGSMAPVFDALRFIVPSVTIIGLMLSYIFYNDKMRMISGETSLKKKLTIYQNAFLIKLTCLEMPLFLAMIAFMLTAESFFMGVAFFIIVAMLFNKPSREEIANDLKLDDEEVDLMTHQKSLMSRW